MANETHVFETRTKASAGRFDGVTRNYTLADVERLSGTVEVEHSLARRGADTLWELLKTEDYVNTLGALTGNQALQQVRAGLKAIYLSGWQVAADSNMAGHMYPDQSIYPANSGPELAKKINNTLRRADQIERLEKGATSVNWLAPIVADCEAGFGGVLNAFEITQSYIEAGAAGVHFEDQLASEKKCGHMGGKVLIPIQQAIANLNSARLAADIARVSTIIMARTDAESARLITSDIDDRDRPYISGERTPEGFYILDDEHAFERCVERGLAYAPYSDLLWMETSTPDLDQARRFAEAIRAQYPNQMLAYNCSPSFNWSANLTADDINVFQQEIGKMGYKFQFITLAGFHSLNYSMFMLAKSYKANGMSAYCELQNAEFSAETIGYTAHRHQREVGAGWFDAISTTVKGGESSTTALNESTEDAQFNPAAE
ncbi:MAG: isocitrate lyase [Alphaproteobacteria bacterium]|nr:isocitrate lyase [Alphaproteobacteria bacterium]